MKTDLQFNVKDIPNFLVLKNLHITMCILQKNQVNKKFLKSKLFTMLTPNNLYYTFFFHRP